MSSMMSPTGQMLSSSVILRDGIGREHDRHADGEAAPGRKGPPEPAADECDQANAQDETRHLVWRVRSGLGPRHAARTLGEGPRQHLKKPVAPGDAMDFSLTGGGGQVSWQIANGTAGWGVGATQGSSLKPTEAVASTSQRRESPTRPYPLADFDKVRYTVTFIDGAPIRGDISQNNMHGFPSGDRLVRTAHFHARHRPGNDDMGSRVS